MQREKEREGKLKESRGRAINDTTTWRTAPSLDSSRLARHGTPQVTPRESTRRKRDFRWKYIYIYTSESRTVGKRSTVN